MKRFTIAFTVRADRLATIVSLLSGEVGDLKIGEHHRDPVAATPRKPPGPRTINRSSKPVSHTRLGKITLAALDDGRSRTSHELGLIFAEEGFASSSASPTLARLVQEGLVTRNSDGAYTLRTKTALAKEAPKKVFL
jgi:hypothetical protein